MENAKESLFVFSVVIHYVYLASIGWSIAFPAMRIWPPERKWSWQYIVSWGLFIVAVITDVGLVVLDWNRWLGIDGRRFALGIPLVVVGALLLVWGIWSLGVENTSGLPKGFVARGPYKFTRNPQYVGDIMLFIGIVLTADSFYALITFSLLTLAFLMMPLAEEIWLGEVYGDEYKEYKKTTPRFL
jgi:protein-S-isoprenylcysteine O-methyltransferase Ste14